VADLATTDFEEFVTRMRRVLDIVMPIPLKWVLAIGAGVILSTLRVSRTHAGVEVSFQVTTITAVLVALLWLPALVRVIALVGGAVKTSGAEVQSGGLLDAISKTFPREAQQEAFASLVAGADAAQSTAPEHDKAIARAVGREAEDRLVSLAGGRDEARRQLEALARRYEELRENLEPGSARTFEMEKVVAAARGLARAADYTHEEVAHLFKSGSQGDRIIALAVVQALGDPAFFDFVLDSVTQFNKPFDQYHALRVLEVLMPVLNNDQRRRLIDALEKEQEAGTFTPSSDRGLLVRRLLRAAARTT